MRILPKNIGEINFRALKLEVWGWIAAGGLLLTGAGFADRWVFDWLGTNITCPQLDLWAVLLTEYILWGVLAFFAVVTIGRVWWSEDTRSKLLPAFFALVATGIAGAILKSGLDMPRPFIVLPIEPLVQQGMVSWGMPSLHTALAFALLIPLWRVSRWIGGAWAVFSLLIGVARVYEHVHWPSDIAGGLLLGGLIGAVFSRPEIEQVLRAWWQNFEFRRQMLHLVGGFLCVFAHWSGVLRWREIAVLLVAGLIASWLTARGKWPWLARLLQLVERPRKYDFPGSGAFYLLLGVGLTILAYDVKIAYASILILAMGDSFNHLYESRVPKNWNLPWNRRKSLRGIIFGVVAGTFAAQFFVPVIPALFASSTAILLESYPWRVGKFFLDDNLIVPLTAGAVLTIFV